MMDENGLGFWECMRAFKVAIGVYRCSSRSMNRGRIDTEEVLLVREWENSKKSDGEFSTSRFSYFLEHIL